MNGYPIPAETIRVETRVVNSRFIATIGPAQTVAEAKAFISEVRAEMPDATHHVHAFRVGYGGSITEGMTDDGEPGGTAGPPVLAVLRGADVGDVVVVVTRYFGGTKLGTGGLVRAYSGAARAALEALPLTRRIQKSVIGIEIEYSYYEQVERILADHEAVVDDRDFGAIVTLYVTVPTDRLAALSEAVITLTAGQTRPTLLDE